MSAADPAYEALAGAARDLDDLLSDDGPPFLLDGQPITPDAEVALLVLHDCLNDLARAALASPEART